MSGGQEKPVPGRTNQKTSSESRTEQDTTASGTQSSSLTGSTATGGTLQQTLPEWMTAGLHGAFDQYMGGAQQLGDLINQWQAAGFSPDQFNAFQSARDVAGGAGGYLPATMDELLATARGDYLYGGDAFNAAVEAAQRQAMPGVLSAFGRAGRDGGLAQTAMAQAFADPFAAQYGNERTRQLQAAQILPGMALLPSQILENIGKQYQNLEQFSQDGRLALYPQLFAALGGATGMANPFLGQQTSGFSNTNQQSTGETSSQSSMDSFTKGKGTMRGTETPAYFPGSQGAGILGGVLSGAGMGAQIGSVVPGIGTGLGALGGGLLGGIGGFF